MDSKDVESSSDTFCILCGQPLRNDRCHFCVRVFGQGIANNMSNCKKCGREGYTIPENVWGSGKMPGGDHRLKEELEYCSKCRYAQKSKEMKWLSLANYIAEELRTGNWTAEDLNVVDLPLGFRRYCREVGER